MGSVANEHVLLHLPQVKVNAILAAGSALRIKFRANCRLWLHARPHSLVCGPYTVWSLAVWFRPSNAAPEELVCVVLCGTPNTENWSVGVTQED